MKNPFLLVILAVVLASVVTAAIFNFATLGLSTGGYTIPAPEPQKYTCVTNTAGVPQCIQTPNGVTLTQCTQNCKKHGLCDLATKKCSESGTGAVCNLGSNECSLLMHNECVGLSCKPVAGGGKPTCNNGPECGPDEHLDCKDKKCQMVAGRAAPQCQIPPSGQRDMCESTNPPPPPPTKYKCFSVTNGGQCALDASGTYTDYSTCQDACLIQYPPNPPPTPNPVP